MPGTNIGAKVGQAQDVLAQAAAVAQAIQALIAIGQATVPKIKALYLIFHTDDETLNTKLSVLLADEHAGRDAAAGEVARVDAGRG